MGDWNSDDLRKFVAVPGADGEFELLEKIDTRLYRKRHLRARFDLPTPMIK